MASASPTVTVIIATYNKSNTLRYAIDSILWQTFDDFELWVIGDGCTDDSAEVVRTYNDSRVHWYNLPENTGDQSEPNNEGLRRSKGKYIAYLNHDDIWLPNHLQVLVDCIDETGADFAFSIMAFIPNRLQFFADFPDYPNSPRPPEATATLHRKDVIDEIGYWKKPSETPSVPRVDYFRRAQFMGKRFELAPFLTALKFLGKKGDYAAPCQQPEYMEKIRNDPDFAHKELGTMLAEACHMLNRPITLKHFRFQMANLLRRKLIKRKVEPARMFFWHRHNKGIRNWRKSYGLDEK